MHTILGVLFVCQGILICLSIYNIYRVTMKISNSSDSNEAFDDFAQEMAEEMWKERELTDKRQEIRNKMRIVEEIIQNGKC